VRQVEDAPHDLVRASALKAEAGALKLRQHARVQPVEQAASGRVEAAAPPPAQRTAKETWRSIHFIVKSLIAAFLSSSFRDVVHVT
jgi:hypothetical protein